MGRFFLAVALSWSAALAQTITVGQGPRQWQDGGGGLDPQFPVSTTELATGNTPGGVIDFEFEPGWIFLQQIDPGRNLALGAEDRGGGMSSPLPSISDLALESMIDGKSETAFRRKAATAGELVIARGIIMDLDLGARFGVNRIRFFPRNTVREAADFKFENDFMRGYSLALNDGSEETSVEGRPQYINLTRVEDNTEAVVDLEIPLQYVRFIRLKSESNIGFEVDEIETYGSGFVPEAQYLSDIFDLEDLAIWGNLRLGRAPRRRTRAFGYPRFHALGPGRNPLRLQSAERQSDRSALEGGCPSRRNSIGCPARRRGF